MVQCTPDVFLNELVRLFERTKQKGCVRVTTKRSAPPVELLRWQGFCTAKRLISLVACRQPEAPVLSQPRPGKAACPLAQAALPART